ncbi:MAG: DNA mismatch repair endonuclease MutL [Planctomycetes bacterium]|nr:DNA mismatch repair endonuclease MutL [Planctomycetota bacterium]
MAGTQGGSQSGSNPRPSIPVSRIQQLDQSIINKIAAGEVIERPANVVKELLENSVDALATRIDVDILEGGAELIRISDNGEGIHPDDIHLAVSSHATSKIVTAEDLFHIQTMGFRGEALASISEVSHFHLRTRQQDALAGTELIVDCGQKCEPQPVGCPPGTTIEIRNLFSSTPVRRKFMRTKGTEFGHISDQFTRVALANPRLHMTLRHNNKTVFDLPPTDRLIDRLELFFGTKLTEQLIFVESEASDVRVSGYVAHPNTSKSSRKSQHLFLNGRWFQDRSIQHALTESYRGLLMVGRQPVAFLFIDMPPSFFDINVHPTKVEVRFVDGQHLYRQTLSMIRTKFLSMDLDSEFRLKQEKAAPAEAGSKQSELQIELSAWAEKQSGTSAAATGYAGEAAPLTRWSVGEERTGIGGSQGDSERPLIRPSGTFSPEGKRDGEEGEGGSANRLAAAADAVSLPETHEAAAEIFSEREGGAEDGKAENGGQAALTPVGSQASSLGGPITGATSDVRAVQNLDCYLVVDNGDELRVIDQQARHERIMYEYLRPRVLNNSVESQRLLIPETLEVSAKEASLLIEQSELLSQIGIGVEEFGTNTVLVNAWPVMLRRANVSELMRDVVEQLESHERKPTRRYVLDDLLHMMSCKAAIKAGQRLAPEEIDSLLIQRHLVDDAHHCVHGRPTALILTQNELDRQFGRLG